jgi:hypothetical protein
MCMQEAVLLLAMSASEAASWSMVTTLRHNNTVVSCISYTAAPHKVRLASVESNLMGIAHKVEQQLGFSAV